MKEILAVIGVVAAIIFVLKTVISWHEIKEQQRLNLTIAKAFEALAKSHNGLRNTVAVHWQHALGLSQGLDAVEEELWGDEDAEVEPEPPAEVAKG